MIKANYFFEYLIANLTDTPNIVDQTKKNIARYSQEMLRQGTTTDSEIYSSLHKTATPYQNVTYRQLAQFAKNIYTVKYQKIQRDDPESSFLLDPAHAPENMSEFECFDFCFGNTSTIMGITSFEGLRPIGKNNVDTALPSGFVHFYPNGHLAQTNHTDPRNITKRIFFNVSPQNALNISCELAKYAADTDAKVYCRFNPDAKNSEPLCLYTNKEQLPEMLGFLAQLEKGHPEFLQPADCKHPFYAPIKPYCSIADESQSKSYFTAEMSKALAEFLETMKTGIWASKNLLTSTYVIGKDHAKVNAANFCRYLSWRNLGIAINDMQNAYKNSAKTDNIAQKQYADDLMRQYKAAQKDPKYYLTQQIETVSQNLLDSMVKNNPSTTAQIQVRLYTKSFDLAEDAQKAKESYEKNGFWTDNLDLNLNLNQVLYDALNLDEELAPNFETVRSDNFFETIAQKLENHNLSHVVPFMTTDTAALFNKYWEARQFGEVMYTGSGIRPANIEHDVYNQKFKDSLQEESIQTQTTSNAQTR